MGIGLNIYAQEALVEKVDSATFELIKLRTREQVKMFIDYYKFIADKNVDMAKKKYYIQSATNLFLPGQGEIVMSLRSLKSPSQRQRKQTAKSFLENVARGVYHTATDINSYEFCHALEKKTISEKEIEVALCKHGDTLRGIENICTMPNGYVKCVMPNTNDEILNRTYLTTVYMDIIVHD